MSNLTLFRLPSIQKELDSVIASSISSFNTSVGDVSFWAETELRRQVEQGMKNYAQQLHMMACDNSGSGDTPGSGFKITFGIQLKLDYRVRFKANLNLGYGQRYNFFAPTASLHLSAYNSGLGVGVDKKNLVVDVTAAANIVIGWDEGTPLQSYTLNYNSPIPMKNDFKYGLSFGQLFTWNSALNENEFSLDRLQREGMIGFRIGDFNISSNNDTKRFYFGGGTDKGWTGGISIVTPLFEVGFQDFSGDYLREVENKNGEIIKIKQEEERERIVSAINLLKNNKEISKIEQAQKLLELKRELEKLIEDKFHNQTDYQKNLNKASTYIRFNSENGANASIDIIGDAWLQNLIHNKIKDFKFEYDHKRIDLWGGKEF